VAAGLISKTLRYNARGKRTSNDYLLHVGIQPVLTRQGAGKKRSVAETPLTRSQPLTNPLSAGDHYVEVYTEVSKKEEDRESKITTVGVLGQGLNGSSGREAQAAGAEVPYYGWQKNYFANAQEQIPKQADSKRLGENPNRGWSKRRRPTPSKPPPIENPDDWFETMEGGHVRG
jgi:hypothetical protein